MWHPTWHFCGDTAKFTSSLHAGPRTTPRASRIRKLVQNMPRHQKLSQSNLTQTTNSTKKRAAENEKAINPALGGDGNSQKWKLAMRRTTSDLAVCVCIRRRETSCAPTKSQPRFSFSLSLEGVRPEREDLFQIWLGVKFWTWSGKSAFDESDGGSSAEGERTRRLVVSSDRNILSWQSSLALPQGYFKPSLLLHTLHTH